MDARHGRIIMLGLLLIALMVSATTAFAIIVHDAEVQVGSTVEVPVEIDQVPYNLWYYNITLTNADPALGELVDVTFPGWTTISFNSSLPSDTLWMKGGNLSGPVATGTENVSLGSFKVRGDQVGTSQVTLIVNTLTMDDGFDFPVSPDIIPGNLNVLEPLPTSGSIAVTSVPDTAEIFIDGIDTQSQTNTTIDGIAIGDRVVKVTLTGYQDAELTVTVTEGQTVNADFILEPVPPASGSMIVSSDPAGAEIWIDGADTGLVTDSTVADLAAGDHIVKVTLAGYEDAEQTVTVIAGETVNADFQLVQLPVKPKAQFLAFPRQGTAPLTVLFLDLSSGSPSSREWDFGDGTTSSELFPLHMYASPGKYTVKLTVKNAGGSDTAVGEDFITVNAENPPKAQFIAYPRQGTAPLTVLFLDLSSGSPISRLWDFGDGTTSTAMFPLHTYAAPGKYTVKLTVTNAGGSDTQVRENFIIVRAANPPKAQFTAYPQSGMAPLTVTFLDLSRGYPSSRVWDFGDGTTSTDVNPVHVYEKPGRYTVTLTVTNDAGSDTASHKNFIRVDAVKVKANEGQESGQKSGGSEEKSGNNSQISGGSEPPKIKIS